MSQPMYLDEKCFVNAYINKFKHYKDLNLKYVCETRSLDSLAYIDSRDIRWA